MEIRPPTLSDLSAVFTVASSPVLNLFVQAFLVLISIYLSWLVLKHLVSILEKRLSGKPFIQENGTMFDILRSALAWLLALAAGTFLISLFDIQQIERPFVALIVAVLAKPANAFFTLVLVYMESRLTEKTETKVDDIIFDLLNRFSGVIIYAVAIVLALDILGINVMPFVAGAGVLGIAIGFAAKDTLSNLIAGVLLIIDRPFEIGDRIEVWSAPAGSASWGDVIDIGLRATKIKTTDNIIIIIPNNEIMKRDIVNYTIITTRIRVRVNIGVSYDADLRRAKELILQTAGKIPWVLPDPKPVVVVTAFGESSVDLQLRAWISNARRRMDTISMVTDRVKTEFDNNGIEIPYPKRDITILTPEKLSGQEKTDR